MCLGVCGFRLVFLESPFFVAGPGFVATCCLLRIVLLLASSVLFPFSVSVCRLPRLLSIFAFYLLVLDLHLLFASCFLICIRLFTNLDFVFSRNLLQVESLLGKKATNT